MRLIRISRGFSFLELCIALFLILTVATFAIPSLRAAMASYRGSAAAHGIASQLSLARMRAAAEFTRTRLTLDTVNNQYRREVLDKSSASYRIDGGDVSLGPSVTFGFGNIALPAGGQSTIQQSTQIFFNSRGMPVDSGGTPIGSFAVYLNYGGRYYAVSINTVGQIRTWKHSGTGWDPE